MSALARNFRHTELLLPAILSTGEGVALAGEVSLSGPRQSVISVSMPFGRGLARKLGMIPWSLRTLPKLVSAMRRADVVHTPIPGDIGTVGLLVALVMRKPLFVRHCGNWGAPRTAAEHAWRWLLERIAGRRAVVLATGGGAEDPSARNTGIRWIFSSSLSAAELESVGTARSLRRDRPLRLTIVCRQDERKGTRVVLEALAALADRLPTATLDVVGDGPDLQAFRVEADSLGVHARVTFHGRLDHEGVLAVLGRTDLFCYPTQASEGFPKVVLEALACGVPVLATPVSVLPSLLSQGGGVIVPQAQADALAAAIISLASDSELYAAMSRGALSTASRYTLEVWGDTIARALSAAWNLPDAT